jgi:hypothetical protein
VGVCYTVAYTTKQASRFLMVKILMNLHMTLSVLERLGSDISLQTVEDKAVLKKLRKLQERLEGKLRVGYSSSVFDLLAISNSDCRLCTLRLI